MYIKYILILIITILFSCNKKNSILDYIYDDNISYVVDMYKDSVSIKLIPIKHLGTEQYYKNLSDSILKSQNDGYFVFYEGICCVKNMTHEEKLKFKQIFNFDIDIKSLDTIGYKHLYEKKIQEKNVNFKFTNNVINQPKYNILISDIYKAKNVDISISEYINKYEEFFGEIDIKSTTKIKGNTDILTINHRNDYVIFDVINSNHKKILIIYGEAHIHDMVLKLKKLGFYYKTQKKANLL